MSVEDLNNRNLINITPKFKLLDVVYMIDLDSISRRIKCGFCKEGKIAVRDKLYLKKVTVFNCPNCHGNGTCSIKSSYPDFWKVKIMGVTTYQGMENRYSVMLPDVLPNKKSYWRWEHQLFSSIIDFNEATQGKSEAEIKKICW